MRVEPSTRPVVTFVTRALQTKWAGLDHHLKPANAPHLFRSGIDVWIIQTYLELKALEATLDFDVAISDRFPVDSIAIAHRDDLRVGTGYHRSYLVDTRADRAQSPAAQWHAVQNPSQLDERSILVPLWPQPGLIARDRSRVGIRTLGFFGRSGSVPGFFKDPAFLAELDGRAISLVYSERDWHDYSATDVCIALRYDPAIGSFFKPFSKLVNAWHAGTPALLGPEPAFRWLRKSELDYLEINSARDVLDALDRLILEPGLYDAMVDNGLARARDYDHDAMRRRWIDFLSNQVIPGWRAWQLNRPSLPARMWTFARQLMQQRNERRNYKRAERAQRLEIERSGVGQRLEVMSDPEPAGVAARD